MQKLAPLKLPEQEVRKWLAEAGYPNAGRNAILPLAALVFSLKANYERKMKDGDIHPNLIAEADEIKTTAEAVKTIQLRLKKLELSYQEDGEPLPAALMRLRDALEDEETRFHLAPLNSAYVSRDRWWEIDLAGLRDTVLFALQLAGRNPKYGDGRPNGPVPKIVARALEFIDDKYVCEETVDSRLERLKSKRKRRPPPSR